MKLQEWSKGKAKSVIQRLFNILAKKTGDKYHLINLPLFYENKYGKFMGFEVWASKEKRMYRVNFVLGKTEEIVSIDRFKKGDKLYKLPDETLSLEGFGISKIFNCILDWIKGEGESLKESVQLDERFDRIGAAIKFLQLNPDWAKRATNGTFDDRQWQKEFNVFIRGEGSTENLCLSSCVKTYQRALKKMGVKGSDSVPVPTVTRGVPSKEMTSGDILAKLQANFGYITQADVENVLKVLEEAPESNAENTIKKYTEYVNDLVTLPDNATRSVIAWGKGGTGKSHHAEQVLKGLGMTEGVPGHYIKITGKVQGGFEGFLGSLYQAQFFSVCIVDDADNVFNNNYRTLILNATQDKPEARRLKIGPKGAYDTDGNKIERGEEIHLDNTKFIFITNKNVLEDFADDTAFTRRFVLFDFNFSDETILKLIEKNYDGIFPDEECLTAGVKEEIFKAMCSLQASGKLKQVDFRVIETAFREYIRCYYREEANPVNDAIMIMVQVKAV